MVKPYLNTALQIANIVGIVRELAPDASERQIANIETQLLFLSEKAVADFRNELGMISGRSVIHGHLSERCKELGAQEGE